jgi:hypothetical protein
MVQGAEFDLKDIRFFTNTSQVDFVEDNRPVEDLNDNTLTVDVKAVLAKNTANASQASLTAHIGGGGASAHGVVTQSVAGFMSANDKIKLDNIQAEAQINILSPIDALELVGGGVTRLHTHITANTIRDGLMTEIDKAKLDGIETGAEVNILTGPQVAGLTGGGDANPFHTHVTPSFDENFREGPGTDGVPPGVTYHTNVDHSTLPGVPGGFPGFTKVAYREASPGIVNLTPNPAFSEVKVFDFDYSPFLSNLAVVTAGMSYLTDFSGWGLTETFQIQSVSKSGLVGTVVYSVFANNPVPELPPPPTDWSLIAGDGLMEMRVWQGGFGISV